MYISQDTLLAVLSADNADVLTVSELVEFFDAYDNVPLWLQIDDQFTGIMELELMGDCGLIVPTNNQENHMSVEKFVALTEQDNFCDEDIDIYLSVMYAAGMEGNTPVVTIRFVKSVSFDQVNNVIMLKV